jgi:hypothetical protein
MSHRPVEQKKRRRVAKQLRRRPLPARIDLIQWLLDHDHAKTRKQARELILDKRVKADSHTLGITVATVPGPTATLDILMGREPTMVEKEVVAQFVDAKHRKSILVLP